MTTRKRLEELTLLLCLKVEFRGGGGLVQTLRKSYSLSDLSEPDTQRTQDEVDEIVNRPQRVLRSKSSRSSSGSRQMDMYFPEVEIAGTPYHHQVPTAVPPYNYIRSSDDISSGYSSAEPGLSRTASMSNTARPRLKSKTREEKMSASCTTLPRTKKPEKVTKTRSKTEKPSI
ncbi:uncharacterized protein LOC131285709 [Anopheles ziemanni]|uniref:uncharacterized protein LOC131285709 n=1 Tax=Anopheles ziemanni TaxID=345580 RepID=UPI00265EF940|nr:uncharacterized protein LOC131285709 [Anopheles ziemanni]